ncbi:MAG: DNA cytosine methyltransferase [Deltaproteobacteria bacterium]|nr:DNA cytosine methyltransferase [Deltaproteobacteria bacterium]
MTASTHELAPAQAHQFTFSEFFAGGGMVRAGLGPQWRCVFANDFDFKKSAIYRQNWGDGALLTKDVRTVEAAEVRDSADLAWASFPCQDLSLAGMGAGLKGDRSGTFWPFWELVTKLSGAGRGPRVVALENVCGTLTSHGGKDFTAIAKALADAGYHFGALVIDAALFVPQSRPRLFIVAVAGDLAIPPALVAAEPTARWHSRALRTAHGRLDEETRQHWVWWNMAAPARRTIRLKDLIEDEPSSVAWHTRDETAKLLGMMNKRNMDKVRDAKKAGKLTVGTVYKRTRHDDDGDKVQRAEVRFDGVAGCLRTSSGGSSRQLIVVVKGEKVRSRLLSSRETARLMGLPDSYALPENYNEAYHLTGDGVVLPVVRHLADQILEPILAPKATVIHLVA